jgi:hypothetical protein
MPNHDAFYVATSLASLGDAIKFADYPTVSAKGKKITVSSNVGEVPVGVQTDAFELPLRFCAGTELNDKQMTVRYKLFGSNLRQPIDGSLSLAFRGVKQEPMKLSSGD